MQQVNRNRELSEPTLPLFKALALATGNLEQPAITTYQLALLTAQLYRAKRYKDSLLRVERNFPTTEIIRQSIERLTESGVLTPLRGFPNNSVFMILGKTDAPPEEVLCAIDPFAYLSHLSAMAFHGLTNRAPKILFYSTPSSKEWRSFAYEKMKVDYGEDFTEFISSSLPKLTNIAFDKIQGHAVHKHSSLHHGAYVVAKGRTLRVSSIGRTFLEMVRRPDLCGGISHVIEVFVDRSSTYLPLILEEIDRHGKPIEKVRAGYILEEKCLLTNSPIVNKWVRYAQRGGSRKLDPQAPYSPEYSERWCISINA